jgi:hypothetical protein
MIGGELIGRVVICSEVTGWGIERKP